MRRGTPKISNLSYNLKIRTKVLLNEQRGAAATIETSKNHPISNQSWKSQIPTTRDPRHPHSTLHIHHTPHYCTTHQTHKESFLVAHFISGFVFWPRSPKQASWERTGHRKTKTEVVLTIFSIMDLPVTALQIFRVKKTIKKTINCQCFQNIWLSSGFSSMRNNISPCFEKITSFNFILHPRYCLWKHAVGTKLLWLDQENDTLL
jgi:hypothetical protein